MSRRAGDSLKLRALCSIGCCSARATCEIVVYLPCFNEYARISVCDPHGNQHALRVNGAGTDNEPRPEGHATATGQSKAE